MGNIVNKTIKVGNSLMIIIPTNIRKIYRIQEGDVIELEFEINHRNKIQEKLDKEERLEELKLKSDTKK